MSDSASETGSSFGHRLHPTAGSRAPGVPGEDLPPPVVPGFTVGRLLGRGGFSSAWLVTDDDGRRFALKIAAPPLSGPESEAESRSGSRPGPVSGAGSGAGVVPPPPPSALRSRGRRAARPEPFDGPLHQDAARLEHAADPAPAEAPESRVGETAGGLERELRLLQRFRHEHLLRVHRMLETDQGPAMLAELAPGGSLLALITSRGPLPISEVVTALAPIAQVLAYLHAEGAAHGDVTPGNILFTSEGKPLLGDLGTGRLLGAGVGTAVGTPGFADPSGDGSYDVGVDVFALAAVCWFALTGRAPGPTEQRPPLGLIVPDVTPALMEVIEDALSETADRRPTPDDLARVLLASATPSPVNLVPAVHASVLPELLTRRVADQEVAAAGRRTVSGRSGRRAGAQRRPGNSSPKPGPGVSGEGHGMRRGVALAGATLAAALLGVGVALAVGGGDPGGPEAGTAGGATVESGAAEVMPGEGRAEERTIPSERAQLGGASQEDPDGTGTGKAATSLDEASTLAQHRDPAVALEGLAALRAQAFTEGDIELLQAVDVGGSPAMAADLDAVGALAEAGRTLDNLSIAVRDPTLLESPEAGGLPVSGLPAVTTPPERTEVALVRATAALSSYTEVSGSPERGATPAPLMAAGQQELVFVLWDSGTGWRIHTVTLAPT